MSKKIILLAILTITISSAITYLYFNREDTPTPQIANQDTTLCTTDADCSWYEIAHNDGRALRCANSNIVLAENATSNSMAPNDTLCLCITNKCTSTTFTVQQD